MFDEETGVRDFSMKALADCAIKRRQPFEKSTLTPPFIVNLVGG
jgi:hypothetical protein